MVGDERNESADRLTRLPGWDAFFALVESTASGLGARGLSLGVREHDRFLTFNVGFSRRTSAQFATIAAAVELPGPYACRTRTPQFFSSAADARGRFPATAAISAGHPFEAAACLPLVGGCGRSPGYLALHYVGRRTFDETAQRRLEEAADIVAASLLDLLGPTDPSVRSR